MGILKVKEKYFIFNRSIKSEEKFRVELSRLIHKEFGQGPFKKQADVQKIIQFSLEYYISNFKEICQKETALSFYQYVFFLHEQATELAILFSNEDLSSEISREYLAKYRRLLKFILETACEVRMKSKTSNKPKKRFHSILNDLLILGEMIFNCVNIYAEQTMVEDAINLNFDKDDLYVFNRNHHYNRLFKYFNQDLVAHLSCTIIDQDGIADLKRNLEDCLGINYEQVSHLIADIHKQNESLGGETVGVSYDALTSNLNRMFNVPIEAANNFFDGLKLDKSNKMDLLDLACKPYKLNRYLYKPIIIWNIDGDDFAFFGKWSWMESILQYTTNAIPWGKAPKSWMSNSCFKKYVHKKEDEHDKWLEDFVEKILLKNSILYDRNVKTLKNKNNFVSIDTDGLGEIDFIILSEPERKIFISDCKHLLGRADLVNQKNDYNSFSLGSKNAESYNQKLERKVNWFNKNKTIIQNHFRHKYDKPELTITNFSIEGIFIINTPTFYMYNAKYRIYTAYQIEKVILGTYSDPTFTIFDGDSGCYIIEYPFFKKPFIIDDPFLS